MDSTDASQSTIPLYDDFSFNTDEPMLDSLTSLNFDLLSCPISPPIEYPLEQSSMSASASMISHCLSPMAPDPTNEEDTLTVISVSTMFHPGAHAVEPDTTFLSSDKVLFYVHSQVLRATSPHAFRAVFGDNMDLDKGSTISDQEVSKIPGSHGRLVHIPDESSVLNIILHLLYGTSAAPHSPRFESLATAVERMPFYEIIPKHHILPRTPLHDLLLTYAPLYPLQLYTLAAQHDIEQLAITTSSHLLSYPLADLPEEMAQCMGAVYLKRLLCLHFNRFNALKNILLSPPHPHPATKECSFVDQKSVTRAWALVAAYLAWDARPDLSTHTMRQAFQPLTENLACNLCRDGLQKRIRDIIVQWASVKPLDSVLHTLLDLPNLPLSKR